MLYLLVGLSILLTGCKQATVQIVPTTMPTGALTPYQTVTSQPISPTATIVVTIPVTPSPTPTPFLHTITNDDTMLGLAFRYGVKLEDLKTANPSVNPNAMSVGSQLVIPIKAETTQELPTSTAVPVQSAQPQCFRSGEGGAWCIVALQNDLETSLENLSVWIGLYTPQGDSFTSQVAYAPLNILRPGSTMPLMVYFAPPLPDEFTPRSEILSANVIAADDPRYLDAVAKPSSVEIDPAGGQAVVTGDVILFQDNPPVSQVWVLLVAYDADGTIVGERKWKSDGETHFEATVYSLGGTIDYVELLTEVRP